MTLANTDVHPSHAWEDWGEYLLCVACASCSCCVGSGSTGNCTGHEGLWKELFNDEVN